MADRAIDQLVAASQIKPADLFVLQQDGSAKKLSGATLVQNLATQLDGHGGISSITKTSTIDLEDTYTITFGDTTTTTYTVTNGEKGDQGDQTYVHIRYASEMPTSNSDMSVTPDAWIGVYCGLSSTAPTSYTSYTWSQFKGDKGNTGAASTITLSSVTYQASQSGTIAPSGSWTPTIPTVANGSYLWTRTYVKYNDNTEVISYSVGRMGIDGSGAVSSVNSIAPDSNGNIQLTASDIQTNDNTSVEDNITRIDGRITNSASVVGDKLILVNGDTSEAGDKIKELQMNGTTIGFAGGGVTVLNHSIVSVDEPDIEESYVLKANVSDADEISGSGDLTDKVASAEAVRELVKNVRAVKKGKTFSSISGNVDTELYVGDIVPSGTILIIPIGYVPTATWATTLTFTNTYSDKIGVRINGSTTQGYSVTFVCLVVE